MGPGSELRAQHAHHTRRTRDSPNHLLLHGAQLLRTEEAEVGRPEAGQHVQGGVVQLAPYHQIAGNQGSHLWEEASEMPWARKRRVPLGQTSLTSRAPLGPHNLTQNAPLPTGGHLSIHFVPFADFQQRFHCLQGCHVPLVDVLGSDLMEEVTQVPDQGLRVPLWVELPGEVTMRATATPPAAGEGCGTGGRWEPQA